MKNWFFETIYFTLPISSFPKNGELDDFDKICSLVNTHFSFGSKIVICALHPIENKSCSKFITFLGFTVSFSIRDFKNEIIPV